MRKILLLLCIISITISAKAQLFGRSYSEGRYYDLEGKKHEGLISWSPPKKTIFTGSGDAIFFKTDKEAEKVKIKHTELTSFVLATDSFVVSKNIEFENTPFFEVIINNPIKLYAVTESHYTAGGMMMGVGGTMIGTPGSNSTSRTYYYGPDQENVTILKRKNFRNIMISMMADKPEVTDKIKDDIFRYGELSDLLRYYKTRVSPPVTTTEPPKVTAQ